MESRSNFQFSSERSNVNWTYMQPLPFRILPRNKNYNRADEKTRLKILNLPSLYTFNETISLPSKTIQSKTPAIISGDNSRRPNPDSPNHNTQTSSSNAPRRQNENKGLQGSCPTIGKNKASSAKPNPAAGILGSHPAGMSYKTAQAIRHQLVNYTNIPKGRKPYTQVQLEMMSNGTFSPKARTGFIRSTINIRRPRGNEEPRGVNQQPVGTSGYNMDVSGKAKLNPKNEEDDSDSNYPFPGHLINMDDYN